MGFLRSDASVVQLGRWAQDEDEPYLGVAVALSSGHTLASLSGAYGFVRFVLRNDLTAQTMRSDYGTITFNGMGGFTEMSDRHQVTWNGVPTPKTSYSGNGMYLVANNGEVTIVGGGGQGAVSRDLEFVFWVRQSCPEVEMVLAVRLPQPAGPTFVDGDWRLCSTEVDVSTSALDSDWGTIALSPLTPTGGSLTPTLFRISTVSTPSGTTTTTPSVVPDSYTLGAGGSIALFSQGVQRRPVPGWVSSDGSMLVGAPSLPSVGSSPG